VGSLAEAVAPALAIRFGRPFESVEVDDCFVIHYSTRHLDTSLKRHIDPSDVTVNLCLRAADVEGSAVVFYGRRPLGGPRPPCSVGGGDCACRRPDDGRLPFCVQPRPGFAMVHYGDQPHETLALTRGERTNCVLTFRYAERALC